MRMVVPWLLAGAIALPLTGCTAQAQEGPPNMTGITSHPCVLVNAETLPELKAKCAADQPTRFGFRTGDFWAEIKRNADRLAALPPYRYAVKIPGEGGVILEEWSYELSDQTPPPHPKSPNYPPWTAMFQERDDSISTRLIHFSFAYLVTGEDLYFQRAREIALHLTKWEQWTDASYGGGRIKACLDTGHCTYSMAMFYDWCYERLTEAERREVREALVGKGIEPILGFVDHYPPDTNGYAVLLSGATLAALAIRPEDARGGGYLTTCLEKTRVSLDKGGKDGGTFEGPMYGTYLLDSFALSFDALTAARVEHDLFEHPYLATMPRYCLGLLAPDTKQIPCFSDGSPGVAVPKLMSILAHRGSKEAAYYLQLIGYLDPSAVYGVYDLIRFDESKLDPQPPAWNPSSVFVDIGYASLRDGFNAQAPSLFFKSGPTTNDIGHNHYDHNAFVVSYGGQWIVPDRGYHDFYVPARRKFSLGSIGHCTVVMDVDEAWMQDTTVPSPGHDQVNRAGGAITEFFAGSAFDYVKGEAAAPYNKGDNVVLDQFDRRIVYVKPHFFVLHDQLAAPQPHAYSFLLHSDGSGDIETDGDGYRLVRTQAQMFTRVLSSVPTRSRVRTYPGAEDYGPFLRVETEPTAAATFTAFLCPQPYQNPEFLRNGDFEQGMAGWHPRANEDLPNHKIVTDNPAQGQQCASIEGSGYYYSDRFSLPAGTHVTARVKIRTGGTPADEGATMHLYFWKGGSAFANVAAGPFRSEAWTEQTISGTVPEGTEQVSLALEYFAPGVGYFDDVRIETDMEVPEPVTPQVTPLGSNGLDVTIGQERYVVLCNTSGQAIEAGGLRTDGVIAVVGLGANGQPSRAFIQGGTLVSWEGRDLLRLSQTGTAEVTLSDSHLVAQATSDVTPHAPLPEQATLFFGRQADGATLNGRQAAIRTTREGVYLGTQ